jgi:hypothetical protein
MIQADTKHLDLTVLAVALPCVESRLLIVEGQGPISLACVCVVIGEKLLVCNEVVEYQETLGMVDAQGL